MNAPTASAENLSSIRAALMRATGTRLTGTQLRHLVDLACPGFDLRAAAGIPTGPGALTTFLRTHFADIVHAIGRQGGDTVFLIGPQPTAIGAAVAIGPVPESIAPQPTSLWAAFASPGLGQDIVFNNQNQTLSVRPRGTVLAAHQVRLAPISPQEFRAMAANFIEQTPASLQDELRKILEEGDLFYNSWVSALKRADASLYHKWGLHRVQAIIDLFRERLVAAGVPHEENVRAVQSMLEAQTNAYRTRSQAIRSGIESLDRPALQRVVQNTTSPASIVDINDVRAIAIAAIGNMSVTEIRQISVPLGAVLDVAFAPRK